MAHNAGISEQAGDIRLAEFRDPVEIETGEGGAEILALAQDGQPRQARLKALQADLLEQPAVVGHRPPPLRIVIDEVVRLVAMPPAAQLPVLATQQPLFHVRVGHLVSIPLAGDAEDRTASGVAVSHSKSS